MAILAFQKPDKVLMLEADNFFGKFEFRPLEPIKSSDTTIYQAQTA